jgi:hypothetical protein
MVDAGQTEKMQIEPIFTDVKLKGKIQATLLQSSPTKEMVELLEKLETCVNRNFQGLWTQKIR